MSRSPTPPATTPPKAVLDSNVLYARWSRHVLVALASDNPPPYLPVWSEWIIAETWRTLAWRWLSRAVHPGEFERESLTRSANEMMRHMLPVMTFVSLRDYTGPGAWPGLADPDDVPVWQTAILADAQFVVSQNVHHFPPLVDGRHVYGGVEYLTAIEFIEDVIGKDLAAEYDRPLPLEAQRRSRYIHGSAGSR